MGLLEDKKSARPIGQATKATGECQTTVFLK